MLVVIMLPLMAACSQTPEQKAEVLIKESLKKTLYKPDTYKPVDTKVDSAFAPYDDPKIFELLKEFVSMGNDAMALEDDMKNDKSKMALNSGPYQTAYEKNEYQEAKDNYEKNSAQHDKIMNKIKDQVKVVSSFLNKEKSFIGYKVTHNYRADNNAGNTLIGNTIFFFDKDMKEIISSMEVEDYNEMQYTIKRFKEEIADVMN